MKGSTPSLAKQLIKNVTDDILKQFTIKTLTDDKTILIYNPDKGFYEDAEPYFKTTCAQHTPLNGHTNFKNLTTNIEGLTYIERKDFVPPYGLLNLSNGVLNIETQKLLPYSPQYNFLNKLDIEFNSTANCPMFDKFMNEILEPVHIITLQEWFGYHFMTEQPLKKAIFLRGEHDTGKTTLLKIMEAFIGKENICHFQLAEFNSPATHALPSLYGKLANTYADSGNRKIWAVDKFKMLTGNDSISARKHYKEPFYFVNGAKLTFASNLLPDLSNNVIQDGAFWERIIFVPFDHQIARDNRDPALAERIINSEMSGILNWVLQGYQRLLKQKRFSVIVPGYETDVKMKWLMDCMASQQSFP